MARWKYSEEYRREAVAMTQVAGVTLQQVAKGLGLNANMLGRWPNAMDEHGERAFPGQGHARDAEVMQLKRERVYRRRYMTRAQARADIFDYIERFYNPRMRRRLKLCDVGTGLSL